MSTKKVPATLRKRIEKTARFRCGYCLTSQHIIGPLLEIDHIIPVKLGGKSIEENLYLACPTCNSHKADKVEAIDPTSKRIVRLFNPVKEEWRDHFEWSQNGTIIQGKTPKGRATITTLMMNNPDIVRARKLWIEAGWHPPEN